MGSVRTFINSFTAGEIAVLAALFGAVPALLAILASIFTTRYLVKHGPNYGKQIGDIHSTLDTLAKTQEELRQQHAQSVKEERERHEAARWKPITKIISRSADSESNVLQLVSFEDFALLHVSLCVPSGAKIYDYATEGAKLMTKRFSVPLTKESIDLVVKSSTTYGLRGDFNGSIKYVVLHNGQESTGEVPFQGSVMQGPHGGLVLNG